MGAVIRYQAGFSSKSFRVSGVDFAAMVAHTEALPDGVAKVYTNPVRKRTIDVLNAVLAEDIQRTTGGITTAVTGDFDVREQTTGYKQFTWEQGERKPIKEEVALDQEHMNPSIDFVSRGVDLVMTRQNPIADCIYGIGADPAILCEALAEAMHKTLPLVVQARPDDVEIMVSAEGSGVRFQFFDVANGGMGWSEAAGVRFKDWLHGAALLLKNCACGGDGCPRCTLTPMDKLDRNDLVDSVLLATK